jgi:outer membrane protein
MRSRLMGDGDVTMTRRMLEGVFVGIAVLAGRPALAQDPVPLSVDEAVARAIAEAPRLAEARAREAAASAAVASRGALARPVVNTTTGFLQTNHVEEFGVPQVGGGVRVIFPDIPSNYRARAEVALPLFTAGRVGELIASAEADRRAAAAESRATSADVTLDAVSAYWTLTMARERVGVLERALERADASLETVRARVDTGLLPPNDALTAQAQRARQFVQLIQARNEAALAEAELGRLAGLDPGRPIALLTPVDRPTPGAAEMAALPIATLVARATANRPERQALTERAAALRSTGDAALSATQPQVAALAAVEPARPNPRFVPRVDEWNTGWDLGLSMTWAVWDGGRARAERAGALAQADALMHRVADFDAVIAVEVRRRLLDLASSRAALEASAEAVSAASEARRVLGERFAVGVATNAEVLDADVAWLEAELEQTRLLASLRIQEARLLRTVGDR